MKALLDEGVPEALSEHLVGHEVSTVGGMQWKGVKNGRLLALIEKEQFEAFITADKRMQFEQTLERRPFAVLLLTTNHRPTLQLYYGRIAAALDTADKGKLTVVDRGAFVPRRFRKPTL